MGNFAENLNLGNRFRPPLLRLVVAKPISQNLRENTHIHAECAILCVHLCYCHITFLKSVQNRRLQGELHVFQLMIIIHDDNLIITLH